MVVCRIILRMEKRKRSSFSIQLSNETSDEGIFLTSGDASVPFTRTCFWYHCPFFLSLLPNLFSVLSCAISSSRFSCSFSSTSCVLLCAGDVRGRVSVNWRKGSEEVLFFLVTYPYKLTLSARLLFRHCAYIAYKRSERKKEETPLNAQHPQGTCWLSEHLILGLMFNFLRHPSRTGLWENRILLKSISNHWPRMYCIITIGYLSLISFLHYSQYRILHVPSLEYYISLFLL